MGDAGLAGSIALGVMHGAVHGDKAEQYMRFAESMTRACYQLYNTTATGGRFARREQLALETAHWDS